MAERIYFHVLEEEGESVYRLVRTYRRASTVDRFAKRNGKPVWVIENKQDYIPVWGHLGHSAADYWDGQVWHEGVKMPPGRLAI